MSDRLVAWLPAHWVKSRFTTASILGSPKPKRRTVENANLQVSAGSEQRQYAADRCSARIYGMLDIGEDSSRFAMTLSYVRRDAAHARCLPVASRQLEDLAIQAESLELNLPAALDGTWQHRAMKASTAALSSAGGFTPTSR